MPKDPEASADGLLRYMWADPDGNMRLPIDPARIAADLGLQVVEANLNERMAGSLVKQAGTDPIILLNRTDSRSRQRFTCAHELGHYVDRISRGDDEVYEFIDHRGPLASAGLDSSEIQANQFAAALLMPARLVRQHHELGERQLQLARRFGVSGDAMGYRLDNLGLQR